MFMRNRLARKMAAEMREATCAGTQTSKAPTLSGPSVTNHYSVTTLAHFHSTNVEYRQCKFIRTYSLLYQGKMMCESEVNQDILSRTDFCFIRTEFYLARTSGSFIDSHRSHNCVRHTKLEHPVPHKCFSCIRIGKVFSDYMSGLEPVVFLEKGARVMLTMN